MKVAVINFSGNVGKTTIARHLLAPRIASAEVISIQSINADDGQVGIPASKLRIVFNQVEDDADLRQIFEPLLSFMRANPFAQASTQCRLGANEVFERAKGIETSLADLAMNATDYKAAIAKAKDTAEKISLARKLGTARFASGVVPELDECFAALELI